MRLRIFTILIIFITTLLVSSCVTYLEYKVEISCDEFIEVNHYGGEFELEVGDKIRLELCSNPTTGFKWSYEMTIENVLKEEDHDFEEPEGDVTGAAGVEVWTFKAVEKGTTEIKMEYSQPWEGGLKAEWACTIMVTVK